MPAIHEMIDGSPRTEASVWHAQKARRRTGLDGMRSFSVSGALVSIGREPPQNSTDNPHPEDGTKPVFMRYAIREIDDPKLRKFLPQNPWASHISSPDNTDEDCVDRDAIRDYLQGKPVRVLVIEDYGTTGIVGDPNQYLPNLIDGEADEATRENTFYWFMRAIAASKPKSGRGGSWGLGKLAAPLASMARTFFCVTKQYDTGRRYLVGQSVVKQHVRNNTLYDSELYYAKENLQDPENMHSWLPIDDEEEIDEFCALFSVDRDVPGTSLIIPFAKDDDFGSVSSISDIAKCIIANWALPIVEGRLIVEFSGLDGKGYTANSDSLREIIDSGKISWEGTLELVHRKPNPAWSSSSRITELVRLADSKSDKNGAVLQIGTPSTEGNYRRSPTAQIRELIPSEEDADFIKVKENFHKGEFIHIHGSLPVWHIDGKMEEGSYQLIIHKTDEDSAEAHFYRDQISLPLVNNKKPMYSCVSSLLDVSGTDNPLAQMLRDSEGPAHLEWNTAEPKFRNKYKHASTTVTFLKDIGKVISEILHTVETEEESLWDYFLEDPETGGGRTSQRDEFVVERNLRIVEYEGNGFNISARQEAPDLTGNTYIIRVGYPKPAPMKLATSPDPRSINIHKMNWLIQGAEFEDVLASDGTTCYDRFRVTITEPDFYVEMTGLDTRLRSQIIAIIEDEEVEE